MKKFVTTLILCLLSALCVFAFTACGEKDEKEKEEENEKPAEVVTTVTEEEWNTALSLIYDGEHSVQGRYCTTLNGEIYYGTDYTVTYNHINETARWYCPVENASFDLYFWQGNDGIYYRMGFDYTTSGIEVGKEAVDKEDFDEAINYLFDMIICGDGFIAELAEEHGYNELTYDEESKEYKGSLELFETEVNYTLKFENGKLIKCVAVQTNEENDELALTLEYKYDDIAFTIPQEVIDMPVM